MSFLFLYTNNTMATVYRLLSDEGKARAREKAAGGAAGQALGLYGFYAGPGGRIVYTVVYPEGAALHYKGDLRQHFVQGNGPAWVPGVRLEEWADDGSAAWTALGAAQAATPLAQSGRRVASAGRRGAAPGRRPCGRVGPSCRGLRRR